MAQTEEALRAALSAAERLSLKRRRELAEQLLASIGPKPKKVALHAAERLPLRLRRELAERLLASTAAEQKSVTVRLRRLSLGKQSRLARLMDKNTDGEITKAEQAELMRLGKEVDETMLSNSVALARAARPELFDARGRLIKSRSRQTCGPGLNRVKRTSREKSHR